MKQLASYISDQIEDRVRGNKADKMVVRLDGFEDLRLYKAVCETLEADFYGERTLIAKLSRRKFDLLSQSPNIAFERQVMLDKEWVDLDDHMTSYRNRLPKEGEKLLVLMMGTDLVSDKGGLGDFFFIDPQFIDKTIGSHYSGLMGERLVASVDNESFEELVDSFFTTLFKYVPKNLLHVSNMMDEWEDEHFSLEEIGKDMLGKLPKWDVPAILDYGQKTSPAKMIAPNGLSIVENACIFISRKKFAKITAATLSKINKQFDEYIKNECRYVTDFPCDQAISSLEQLRAVTLDFASGSKVAQNRALLIRTDYSILNEILSMKLPTSVSTQKPYRLNGTPLQANMSALLATVQECLKEKHTIEADKVHFIYKKISIAGYSTSGDRDEDKDSYLTTTWRRLCYFAGGVIEFIGQESWELGDDLLLLSMEPKDFFTPSNAPQLLDAGYLNSVSAVNHSVEMSVILESNGESVYRKDFTWVISPTDDWALAFDDLEAFENNENAMLPFGVWKRFDAAMLTRNESDFTCLLQNSLIDYRSINILKIFQHAYESHRFEPAVAEELRAFADLGFDFVQFCSGTMQRGFYSEMHSSVATLVTSYQKLGERIASLPKYHQLLKQAVKYYVNAFLICPNSESILGDIFVDRAIVTPFHPAILEKISDQMIFMRTGLKQWYDHVLGKSPECTLAARLKKLVSLATIHSGVDALVRDASRLLPCTGRYGYYSIYGQVPESTNYISAQDIAQKEVVYDDDFDESEFREESAEARMLMRVMDHYAHTFVHGHRTLSLVFINPYDLQVVVSSVFGYICKEKKDNPSNARLSIRLTVITPNEIGGARSYLAYWMNSMFTVDENIDIKVYIRQWEDKKSILDLVPAATDIIFFMDALNTDANASYRFRTIHRSSVDDMTACRFPMVFKPALSGAFSTERTIDITQSQFQAATAHTQAIYTYQHTEQLYVQPMGMVISSNIDKHRGSMLDSLHEKTMWLVCIDSAIDKKAIRDMYSKDANIIGFTTGEGSCGQYNLAITARKGVATDIVARCKRRLRTMFPSWNDDQLQHAADFCLDKAKSMDGISILRALNPNDYEINNYLAYIIADQMHPKKTALRVLIRLDSYRHWFNDDATFTDDDFSRKIPDFLLLESEVTQNCTLAITATVIECKIAKVLNMGSHIEKASEQVLQGIATLQKLFSPNDDAVEHRYWMAQLYRAIVFLQTDFGCDDAQFQLLKNQLDEILEGNFTMDWKGQILGAWIDMNGYQKQCPFQTIECNIDYIELGQQAIQNMLLAQKINEEIPYDVNACLEGNIDDAIDMKDIEEDINDTDSAKNELTEGNVIPAVLSETTPEIVADVPTTNNNQSLAKDHMHPQETEVSANDADNPKETDVSFDLTKLRVLIGQDATSHPVHWDFGHPNLSNRHLMITGGSGQGKTYAIQTFLYELAMRNVSSVVFDYTDGFLLDKMEPEFVDALGGRIHQHVAIAKKIPINPFRQQSLVIDGKSIPEMSTSSAGRFASIMAHVYEFGDQQYSAIYSACKDGIDKYGDEMDFKKLKVLLENSGISQAKTVHSKMIQLFDMDLFDTKNSLCWDSITEGGGNVMVIQLTTLDRKIQTIITEMLMWDAWYSLTKTGKKDKPFVVVLDEAQNLSFKDGSPAQKILQEGRKYGWSAWFATQILKGALATDEISRLQQAAERLIFKPTAEEIPWIASQLAAGSGNNQQWMEKLKKMQKGQCIVWGDRMKPNGVFGASEPTIVKVSSFEDRN